MDNLVFYIINTIFVPVSNGCTETKGNWKMDQHIPSLRPSSGLLDMLAEVASQTLHSDPTVKTSPAKKKVIERAVREHREKPEQKESTRRKAGKVIIIVCIFLGMDSV